MHLRGKCKYEYKICQPRDSFCDTWVHENMLIFINEIYGSLTRSLIKKGL